MPDKCEAQCRARQDVLGLCEKFLRARLKPQGNVPFMSDLKVRPHNSHTHSVSRRFVEKLQVVGKVYIPTRFTVQSRDICFLEAIDAGVLLRVGTTGCRQSTRHIR